MKKKNKRASLKIEEGLFFPEDFKMLHPKIAIFIKEGKLIDLRKL